MFFCGEKQICLTIMPDGVFLSLAFHSHMLMLRTPLKAQRKFLIVSKKSEGFGPEHYFCFSPICSVLCNCVFLLNISFL